MKISHAIFRLKNNFALDWENKDLNAKLKKISYLRSIGKIIFALDWHCARLGRARLGQIGLRAIGMRSIGHTPLTDHTQQCVVGSMI